MSMSRSSATDLVPFLKEEAGEYLRSVVHYCGKDREILYLKEEIEEQYTEDDLEDIFESLFFEAFGRGYQEEMYVHGQLNCVVRCFDEAVELHFPHGETTGTAVALEPAATADLEGLVDNCLTELYGDDSPTA